MKKRISYFLIFCLLFNFPLMLGCSGGGGSNPVGSGGVNPVNSVLSNLNAATTEQSGTDAILQANSFLGIPLDQATSQALGREIAGKEKHTLAGLYKDLSDSGFKIDVGGHSFNEQDFVAMLQYYVDTFYNGEDVGGRNLIQTIFSQDQVASTKPNLTSAFQLNSYQRHLLLSIIFQGFDELRQLQGQGGSVRGKVSPAFSWGGIAKLVGGSAVLVTAVVIGVAVGVPSIAAGSVLGLAWAVGSLVVGTFGTLFAVKGYQEHQEFKEYKNSGEQVSAEDDTTIDVQGKININSSTGVPVVENIEVEKVETKPANNRGKIPDEAYTIQKSLEEITLSKTSTTVNTGTTYDLSQVIVTGFYNDTTTKTIFSGIFWSGTGVSDTTFTAPNTAGTYSLTCVFQGKTAEFTVKVIPDNSPSVEFIFPTSTTISATDPEFRVVVNNVPTIQRVEFGIDEVYFTQDRTTSSGYYNFTLPSESKPSSGWHTITAKVYSASGVSWSSQNLAAQVSKSFYFPSSDPDPEPSIEGTYDCVFTITGLKEDTVGDTQTTYPDSYVGEQINGVVKIIGNKVSFLESDNDTITIYNTFEFTQNGNYISWVRFFYNGHITFSGNSISGEFRNESDSGHWYLIQSIAGTKH